jgi:hypothetical protein
MSMLKQVQLLESDMFETIHDLLKAFHSKNSGDYTTFLAILENLNDEYKDLTGQYYIEQTRIISYHEKRWEM